MESIISLAGDIGAGKGTIGKLLIDSLGYDFLSTGNILREIAGSLNMDIVELNKYAESHKEIDAEADKRLIELEYNAKELIVDSRLAWHFIPSSFKVYLSVSFDSAAKRIYKDKERKSERIEDIESLLAQIKERRQLELQRFNSLYRVKCDDYKNYDLVIQTDYVTPNDILIVILKSYWKWKNAPYKRKIYISPTCLIPLEHVRQVSRNDANYLLRSVGENEYNEDQLEPIEIIKNHSFFYIWNGHKRCSAAIFNKIKLIPAFLVASNESEKIYDNLTVDQFLKTEFSKSLMYDWEDCHGFTFENYPD